MKEEAKIVSMYEEVYEVSLKLHFLKGAISSWDVDSRTMDSQEYAGLSLILGSLIEQLDRTGI